MSIHTHHWQSDDRSLMGEQRIIFQGPEAKSSVEQTEQVAPAAPEQPVNPDDPTTNVSQRLNQGSADLTAMKGQARGVDDTVKALKGKPEEKAAAPVAVKPLGGAPREAGEAETDGKAIPDVMEDGVKGGMEKIPGEGEKPKPDAQAEGSDKNEEKKPEQESGEETPEEQAWKKAEEMYQTMFQRMHAVETLTGEERGQLETLFTTALEAMKDVPFEGNEEAFLVEAQKRVTEELQKQEYESIRKKLEEADRKKGEQPITLADVERVNQLKEDPMLKTAKEFAGSKEHEQILERHFLAANGYSIEGKEAPYVREGKEGPETNIKRAEGFAQIVNMILFVITAFKLAQKKLRDMVKEATTDTGMQNQAGLEGLNKGLDTLKETFKKSLDPHSPVTGIIEGSRYETANFIVLDTAAAQKGIEACQRDPRFVVKDDGKIISIENKQSGAYMYIHREPDGRYGLTTTLNFDSVAGRAPAGENKDQPPATPAPAEAAVGEQPQPAPEHKQQANVETPEQARLRHDVFALTGIATALKEKGLVGMPSFDNLNKQQLASLVVDALKRSEAKQQLGIHINEKGQLIDTHRRGENAMINNGNFESFLVTNPVDAMRTMREYAKKGQHSAEARNSLEKLGFISAVPPPLRPRAT